MKLRSVEKCLRGIIKAQSAWIDAIYAGRDTMKAERDLERWFGELSTAEELRRPCVPRLLKKAVQR